VKDIFEVQLTKKALKNLKKVPLYVTLKLQAWVNSVWHDGLCEARKIPGYHDEPLQRDRMGQRSIRLSKSYRAIYVIEKEERIYFVVILEVNKHGY